VDAQIIPFPSVKPTCSDCEWAAFSSSGTYCIQFHEEIWNEDVAQECELFDPLTKEK
jgi:hypothetical protein